MNLQSRKVYASSLTQALSEERKYSLEAALQTDDKKEFLDKMTIESQELPLLLALDANIETVKAHLESFYNFFCFPGVEQRVGILFDLDRDLKSKFVQMEQQFGHLHVACVNTGLCDIETTMGKEVNDKLTLIAFCMKTSFEQMLLKKMLQHAKDPDMQSMLQELTPEAMFQEFNMSTLKKHQQLIYFYLRKASRNQYRKLGDKLYKPKYNAQNEFVFCYEYVSTIAEFVFESLYPLEQNHYWFQCLTKKPNISKYVIEILTQCHTEWLPKLKVNNNITVFQNGIFYSINKQFYKFESIRDLMLLENNITGCEYHDYPLNL